MVPDRADTWTRMVYAGPNKPIAPIDDPYQMFAKLYGRMKDQESLKSILDDLQDDLKKVGATVSAEDRQLLDEHATFVREMEQELKATEGQDARPRGARARAGREGRERQHPADQQDADRPDGQQLRRRLRPRRDAAVHQLGRRRPDALARRRRRPPRALAQAGQRRGRRRRS